MAKKKVSSDQSPSEAEIDKIGIDEPKYSDDESSYRQFLLQRMENARNIREQAHDEFNGLTYTQRYVENFKAGNSYTPPRKNPEDTSIVTGTTREKKNAVINAVLSLVFDTTFRAFDNNNLEDQQLGEAMSDCVFQANQIEGWDEQKIFAYSELADQGDVFIEDIWVDEKRVDKKKIKLSDLTEEVFQDFDATRSMKTVFSGARRRVIPGPQVYLGNIREFNIKNQPFIFTRQIISYEEAKAIYGSLPRFKNVPRTLKETDDAEANRYGYNWSLETMGENMVEVLCYQDKYNDEYQILLNGVMQLPVRFPMPWETGEYNIVQGHLEPISAFFAYSKSIPDKTFMDQQVIDEMLRIMVLKNQKSFAPPIANYSANILTKEMFLPGKVNNDLEKGEVEVFGGNPSMYAVQNSEFEMYKLMKDNIDGKSVSPSLTGTAFGSRTTAVEVDSVTKAAKQQLGIMIFGFMNLHLNLDYLRLLILLENYTKEQGEKVSDINGRLERKYKSLSVERDISGRGMGTKRIEFTTSPSDPQSLYDQEEGVNRDEMGAPILPNIAPAKPVKITQINPETLRSIKYTWYPQIQMNERESSMADKISFEDRIVKAAQFFGIESMNMEYVKQQWAQKNEIDPTFFFTQGTPPPVPQDQIDAIPESVVNQKARMAPTGIKEAVRQGAGG